MFLTFNSVSASNYTSGERERGSPVTLMDLKMKAKRISPSMFAEDWRISLDYSGMHVLKLSSGYPTDLSLSPCLQGRQRTRVCSRLSPSQMSMRHLGLYESVVYRPKLDDRSTGSSRASATQATAGISVHMWEKP